MYPLDVTHVVLRPWRAGVRGRNRSTDRYRCGGTGLPQASGLFVSLPFRHATARLVPSVCGTLPPREGGLHVRLSHRIVHHAMAKQLPLS